MYPELKFDHPLLIGHFPEDNRLFADEPQGVLSSLAECALTGRRARGLSAMRAGNRGSRFLAWSKGGNDGWSAMERPQPSKADGAGRRGGGDADTSRAERSSGEHRPWDHGWAGLPWADGMRKVSLRGLR